MFQLLIFTRIAEQLVISRQIDLSVFKAPEKVSLGISAGKIETVMGIGVFCPIIAGHTQLPVGGNYFGNFIDVISLWQLANCSKVIPSKFKAVPFRFFLFGKFPL